LKLKVSRESHGSDPSQLPFRSVQPGDGVRASNISQETPDIFPIRAFSRAAKP
jgi:hypothetical protein